MKLENIVKTGIFATTLAVSGNLYATEAQVATPEQIKVVKQKNNIAISTPKNEKDWRYQEQLIDSGKVTVLIKPVKGQPGYCYMGLDGFPQKYDLPADPREKDGELRKAEMILNFAEKDPAKKFYFPCDLKASETPSVPDPDGPIVPGPKGTEKSSQGKFGVSIGYLAMGTAKDPETESKGVMHGGIVKLTYQFPKKGRPWVGAALAAAGDWSGINQDLEGTATEGPLAGRLTMKGTNEFSYQPLSLGVGIVVGGEAYANEKNTFGLGIEGLSMLMHDWEHHKFGESSAQYIDGKIVEGSDISNHSDRIDHNLFMAHQLGLRLRFSNFCLTPSAGFRTNFAAIYPIGALSLGYCPKPSQQE